jgi:hypothetical protein
MADNYSILMSHFTWQHDTDPHDIRTVTYLGVGIDTKNCVEGLDEQ